MIVFQDVTKVFALDGKRKTVAQNITATFPSGKVVALLGRNGAGKSTLLELISGTQKPTSGRIDVTGSVSWPVGFAGSFHPELTGSQNVRFVARIYGVDSDALRDFVADFAGLGVHYHLPFRTYSAGMKSRLAFGVSMGIAFDTYLIDEITAVGDAAFQAKSQALFRDRMKRSGAVMVSHNMAQIRALCEAGAVLENGHLTYFDDLDAAIARHEANMSGGG